MTAHTASERDAPLGAPTGSFQEPTDFLVCKATESFSSLDRNGAAYVFFAAPQLQSLISLVDFSGIHEETIPP